MLGLPRIITVLINWHTIITYGKKLGIYVERGSSAVECPIEKTRIRNSFEAVSKLEHFRYDHEAPFHSDIQIRTYPWATVELLFNSLRAASEA